MDYLGEGKNCESQKLNDGSDVIFTYLYVSPGKIYFLLRCSGITDNNFYLPP